jgi:hypothetical protein
MGTPLAAFLATLALLVGLAALKWNDGSSPVSEPSAPVATIAERVEALRGLRFAERPVPQRVTPEEARREGLADLDRGYPAARRDADETLYEMLGLVPEHTDLRKVQASVFTEQVGGYYDPRTGRLRVVEGTATSNRVLDEMTLAHELTHALEDQALHLDLKLADATDDRGMAYRTLAEGTATSLMFDYVDRYFKADVALGAFLGSAFTAAPTTPLPPFIQAGLTFPYLQGREFVAQLRRRGGWRLVDTAFRRPPESTEQVMHPDAWLLVDRPESVAAPEPPAGDGWRRIATGTFGEWQTGELLATAGSRKPEAAAGWEGDAYALYRGPRGPALEIRWLYESDADARDLAAALEKVASDGDLREPARVRRHGRTVTLSTG